ncbi:UDP-glucose 4-epimerase family protein [Burkholderia stagnalis]|uniref:UDP-glucose 4-epimerase family protein n=1 Tax=Burkholderia stagnalis TaxID=1503054 RepID=UPI0007585600|nr:SDR family oxidoreductase [Burkholderia stagnalis]KVL88453.1 NAD-dependent dehydratase [Burkholderia stagnalis]KVL99335.1 NAD-dependent dehydratase [Burkholderia stagnalis]KVM03007.1 NAD-dependent dehydratase [Burkholderia stagnalis]
MILVTGANGFVGQATCRALLVRGEPVVSLVRHSIGQSGLGLEWVHDRPDFAGIEQAWPDWVRCDAVIHLAARVHIMRDSAVAPMVAYRETNVEGALRVARAAHAVGTRRFVYVSSIKAVGESSAGRAPLGERDVPMPTDPYGVSKLEAERNLIAFGRDSGMEIVIVRPPLVYGPGVRANFEALMRALSKGVPLPLGAISARRSLIYVENLASALVTCARDSRAAGQIFHVADSRDLTVTELVRSLAAYLDAPARLLPVPASWLRIAGRLTGRLPEVERLVGALQLDTRRIRDVLDWRPLYDIDDGLRQTATWYRSTQ